MTGLDMTIICEPGRYLMANNGYFLTKVLYEKVNGDRRFVGRVLHILRNDGRVKGQTR